MWRALWIAFVALGAVLAAVVFAHYREDISAARLRVATDARIAETACGPIQYAVEGEGAPVLAIHGAGGGFDQGLDIFGPLARSGFKVIAVSRFGYLGTPLPEDASPESQARAHACLLDALNVPSAAVMGASAGSPSALQFAILYPERTTRLVLVVPAAYVPRADGAPPMKTPSRTQLLFDTALRSDFLFWAAIHWAPDTVTRALLATPPELVDAASVPEQNRVELIMDHILPVSPRRLGLLNDARVVSSLARYDLERITAPTLVITAEDDLFGTFDTARYTADNIRGAGFVGYQTGGHLLVGHDDEDLRRITAFLK